MGFKVLDSAGSEIFGVNGVGLGAAITRLLEKSGYVIGVGETTNGNLLAIDAINVPQEVSDDYRLRVGIDTLISSGNFAGAIAQSSMWNTVVTTMTAVQTAGVMTLNNSGITTLAGTALMTSRMPCGYWTGFGVTSECIVALSIAHPAGVTAEWGFGYAVGTAVPTDGAFFRLNATQEFRAVVSYGGTEVQSPTIDQEILGGPGQFNQFLTVINDSSVVFFINDEWVATIPRPTGAGTSLISGGGRQFFRITNTVAPAIAQKLLIGSSGFIVNDSNLNIPLPIQMGLGGKSATQTPVGVAQGNNSKWTLNTDAVTAVPTGTTAALGTGFGGVFKETNSLALNTDGIIASYQCPIDSSALPGQSLVVYGFTVSSYVQAVLTGGGYNEEWGLAYGHTSVSLATAESASSKAPRRVFGAARFVAAAAAVTTQLTDIKVALSSPVVVMPGEFLQVVVRKYGTVGLTGDIKHVIAIDGHFF